MHHLPASTDQKLAALRQSPYFSQLKESILLELVQGTSLSIYAANESICWHGDECRGLYIIDKGSVKLFKLSRRGRELIIRVLEEGATFNEVPVFDQGTNVVNVAALETSHIWLVKAALLRAVARQHPELSEAVILNLSKNLRTLVTKVEELSFYQVTTRLARLINELPPAALSGELPERLTQDQIAARLGTVREVVTRSLRELERSGAIHVKQRKIHVINKVALEDWIQE